jgi:hypothetical protein
VRAAQPPSPPPPPASAASAAAPASIANRTVELRLALSPFALRTLSEPRLRRLIEIETESFAVLAPGSTGPLGDHAAYVWVDQPTMSKVVVEVRVGDRAVERREIAVRGLNADVSARLIAVAVSEMVRAGMAPRPVPPPPPPGPRRPTPDELERASRSASAVVLTPEGVFAGLPAVSGVLGGAGLSIAFRSEGLSEMIFARWMAGFAGGSDLRWLELGLGADYRFWLGRSWRIVFGGSAALASLHLADAVSLEGQAGDRDTWSARAGGILGVELKVAPSTWLSLTAEPGALLRPVTFTGLSGATSTLQGAWLGAGLAVRFERVRVAEAL